MQFVQDKENLRVVGSLATFKNRFDTALTEAEVRVVLDTTDAVTSNYSDAKPYVRCSFWDAAGNEKAVTYGAANTTACAGAGEQLAHLCWSLLYAPCCHLYAVHLDLLRICKRLIHTIHWRWAVQVRSEKLTWTVVCSVHLQVLSGAR
jgi:hypothetical protein